MIPFPWSPIITCPLRYTVVGLFAALLTLVSPFPAGASEGIERATASRQSVDALADTDVYPLADHLVRAAAVAVRHAIGGFNAVDATPAGPVPRPDLRCAGCFHESW
jgi:hypothetical protein